MKTKNSFIMTVVATVTLGASTYLGLRLHANQEKEYGLLFQQNIEALTDDETGERWCTRATLTCNCYDSSGQWCGTSIVAVEKYKVESVVQRCEQAQTTSCPNGSSC